MTGRRRLATVVVVALLSTACGGGSSGTKVAEPLDRPPVTNAPSSTTTGVPSSSSTSLAGGGGLLLGELISAIPDEGVHPRMAGAFGAVNDAAAACGSLPEWTGHMTLAANRFENLIPRIQSSPALAEWRGTAQARALSDAIRDRFVLMERCEQGATSASEAEVRQATFITGRAVAVSDWYRIRLYQAQPSIGADMWYHADQLGHLLAVEQVTRANDGIDIVFVGASRVKQGIDALALGEATGDTVMNGGMALLYPTVMSPWIEQLLRRGRRPGHVVIGVGASDAYRQCSSARRSRMDRAVQTQEQAFATLPVLAAIDRETLLVGASMPSYTDSPVLRSHRATTIADSHGTGITGTAPDPAMMAADRDRYLSLLTEPVRCDEIVESLADVVAELTGQGVQVTVVGMPLHPEVRAMPPGGEAVIDAVTAEQATLAEDAGARFVDLSTLLNADEFVDLTVPTEAGRVRLTQAVADALDP